MISDLLKGELSGSHTTEFFNLDNLKSKTNRAFNLGSERSEEFKSKYSDRTERFNLESDNKSPNTTERFNLESDRTTERFNLESYLEDEVLYLTGQASYTLTDGVDSIYVYPKSGPVSIYLGTNFESDHIIFIKDTTLEHAETSSFNINLIAKRIECYNGLLLTVGTEYIINSCGGAVTLRFAKRLNTWIIESQFFGNGRSK